MVSLALADLPSVLTGAPPRWVAQVEILLDVEAERRMLTRWGLSPNEITVQPGRPDLVEVIEEPAGWKLRVWDYKGSQKAKHAHYMQVAFYGMLLEEGLRATGLDAQGYRVDTQVGVIRARTEDVEFELAPYRSALDAFSEASGA